MVETESQFLSVIRIWAAMAWADGVVDDAEAAAMRRLIQTAELSEDERDAALAFLDSKVELDTSNVSQLSDDARRGIYRAACRLAAVDRDVADAERKFLDRLRGGLELPIEAAREIEGSIPGAFAI